MEKYKDKPFALLGVNSDAKETARASAARNRITWRSFWDGGDAGGPIAQQWGVMFWPTVYLLDHKGTIRFSDVHGEALEQAIDSLLAEVAAEAQG